MAGVDEHHQGGAEGRTGIQISEISGAVFRSRRPSAAMPAAVLFRVVIARSDSDEAIHLFCGLLDCFASLAMTWKGYAALRSSARLASWGRISVVPARRSSGVSHSWKNTTFMSGRTLAAWPCWRMK